MSVVRRRRGGGECKRRRRGRGRRRRRRDVSVCVCKRDVSLRFFILGWLFEAGECPDVVVGEHTNGDQDEATSLHVRPVRPLLTSRVFTIILGCSIVEDDGGNPDNECTDGLENVTGECIGDMGAGGEGKRRDEENK